MGPFLTLRRIILPQAMRAILPGIANDTIGMIKGTSIASVIFVNELTFRSQQIVGQNFKFFTVFAAAGIIYLMMTSAISLVQALARAALQPGDRAHGARRSSWRRFARTVGRPAAGRRRCRAGRRRPRRRSPPPRPEHRRTVAHALLGATIARRTRRRPTTSAALRRLPQRAASPTAAREVLRGIDLTVKPRRGGDDHRAERLRQEHAAAPDQSSRACRLGRDHGRRQACRLRSKRRRHAAADRATSPRRAPRRASAWCSSTSTCSTT